MIRSAMLWLFGLAAIYILYGGDLRAQSEYSVWQFGDGNGLDFRTTPPTPILSGGFSKTFEGVASYCDTATGETIITCDGTAIYDRNGNIMPNGNKILGGDSTSAQAACIVPLPCSSTKFIVVTTDLFGYLRPSFGSHYSVVDMTFNNGLGDVIIKNAVLNPLTDEHLAVVHYGIGPDYWAILHNATNNTFYAYRITASGISTTPVLSKCGFFSELGYLKSSPDGKKLVMTGYSSLNVDLYDFDPMTGIVSHQIDLFSTLRNVSATLFPYGACFSPDNSKVYFSVGSGAPEFTRIYQCDLSNPNPTAILSSLYCITDLLQTASPNKLHGAIEIGPDSQLYVSTWDVGISVIASPNLAGAACNYQDSKYILSTPTIPYQNAGLPNNIEGRAIRPGIDTNITLLVSADSLFTRDTATPCTSKKRTITINTFDCDYREIFHQTLRGDTLSYFLIDTPSLAVTGEFKVTIEFAPQTAGKHTGSYELILDHGDTITVKLAGFGLDSSYILSASPDSIAFGDSVTLCSSVTRSCTIGLEGCILPDILGESIHGKDSADFVLSSAIDSTLGSPKKITITFTATSLGASDAEYNLTLTDGRVLRIPLHAFVINAPVTFIPSAASFFSKDSLSFCDSLEQVIHIAKSDCSVVHILTQILSGADASDYTVISAMNDSLLLDNSIRIRFHPSAVGKRNAVYTITLDNGQKITIPLGGTGIIKTASITYLTPPLYGNDSLSVCDSSEFEISITKRGCGDLHIVSQQLGGLDSGDFIIVDSLLDSLDGTNIVRLRFHPSDLGKRIGNYSVLFDDGQIITIPLSGFGIDGAVSVTLSDAVLFQRDSITECDSIDATLHLHTSGCGSIHILSTALSGIGASDYRILSSLPDSLGSDNILRVRFHPSDFGKRTADYIINFDNNTSKIIPFEGVGINGNAAIALSTNQAFETDTLSLCNEKSITITLQKSGCGIVRVVSQSITGISAPSYSITNAIADSVLDTDALLLRFHPITDGLQSAQYSITFDNGKTITIPLAGVGRGPVALALSSGAEFQTDTIGQLIAVPISISGVDSLYPFDVTVHFDRNLTYLGTVNTTGKALDVAGTLTNSSSRIHFDPADLEINGASAFSKFAVFVDTEMTSAVTFDSFGTDDPNAQCHYIISQTASANTVIGPVGCGVKKISDFLRDSTVNYFRITPNPSSQMITITSRNSGIYTIRICDALGRTIIRDSRLITPEVPATFDLNTIVNGVYHVLLTSEHSSSSIPIVVAR